MTEEVVAHVRGEEISENGDDHRKIKPEHCNGLAHKKEGEVNGNVGGDVNGGTEAVADSGASDPVVVDGDGALSKEQKVDGESRVTVTEGESEWEVVNNNKESDCNGACAMSNGSAEGTCETMSVVDVVVRESDSACAGGQNGSGSITVSGDHKDGTVTVAEGGDEVKSVQNGVPDKEQSENVVENDIHDDDVNNSVVVEEKGVTVHDHKLDDVAVVDSDVQDSVVEENGIHGDVDSVVEANGIHVQDSVVEENGIHGDVDSEDNGIQNGAEEDISAVVEGVSSPTTDVVESDEDHKNVGSKDVSVEEHVVTNGNHHGDEIETVVVGEKNEIPVDGVSVTTDLKECDDEDAQNGLEEGQVESVSDKSMVGAGVQNGLAELELSGECVEEIKIPVEGREMERSEEESGRELVAEGENMIGDGNGNGNVAAVENEVESSNNMVKSEGESSVDVSEMRNNEMEVEAEPSTNAVEIEAKPSTNAMEDEAEPSTNAVEVEAKPSTNAMEDEAEPSTNAVEVEGTNAMEDEAEPSTNTVVSEPSTNAVEVEAKPSTNAMEDEARPSTNAVEVEAKPSTNAMEDEAEPSTNAVEVEGTNLMEDEAEPSTNTVASEAEASVGGEGSNHAEEDSRSAQEGSTTDMGGEVVKKPTFFWIIKYPRYDDDENIKDQIRIAQNQVDEKTKIRDSIRAESQTKKTSCKEYNQEVRAAISAERAARDLLKSKRQEMDLVQSTVNRLNNAISVGDIEGKIKNMEHMMQHETLPLKEEKQMIRQIKQLKQNRDELSTIMGKQDQSIQSLDEKDSIEEHFKRLQLLKKEMELLRNNVLKAEAATRAARKKYDDECNELSDLLAQFKAADDIRQEAYAKLHALRKQLHEKSKHFWEYRNASFKGQELAATGKREELECFCIDQVERTMEMWNKNDEFRRDYVRCNTRSTLRRLQTLDGRSLGPDEQPPVIPNAFTERASKSDSLVSQEQEKKPITTESVTTKDEPASKVVVNKTEKSQTAKAKKPTKPSPLEKSVAVPRWGDESDEDTKEPKEPVRTKEEEELILKAEKARKEEEAAKLKEMRRLEEIEKAKEAQQRKKRNAEKAQQRAALKAQKEAEQKEKEREKRAKKKERRKAAASTDAVAAAAADNTEQEASPSSETLTRPVEECEQSEKPVEVATKRSQKPSQFTRQTKVKSLPMALRNRGRRRIQPWMWVLIAVLVVVALFYMVGNSNSLRSSLQGFGF